MAVRSATVGDITSLIVSGPVLVSSPAALIAMLPSELDYPKMNACPYCLPPMLIDFFHYLKAAAMSDCTHDCNQGRNCTCRATYYGPRVRTRTEPGPRDQDYEVVEELRSGRWVRVAVYGHMSNDYALTEARQMAQSLSRKYIGAN